MTGDRNIHTSIEDQNLESMAQEVKQAYAKTQEEVPAPSVDAAWKKFNAQHHVSDGLRIEPTRKTSFWRRYGVAACLLFACMAIATITLPKLPFWKADSEMGDSTIPVATVQDEIEGTTEEVIYKNVPLMTIVEELAAQYGARIEKEQSTELRLYVTLERSWSLQECIDFLNHFEQVNLTLTSDNVIVVR